MKIKAEIKKLVFVDGFAHTPFGTLYRIKKNRNLFVLHYYSHSSTVGLFIGSESDCTKAAQSHYEGLVMSNFEENK